MFDIEIFRAIITEHHRMTGVTSGEQDALV